MAQSPDPRDLELHGGHPALDLVNTIDPRTGPAPHLDYLPDFSALAGWSVRAGLIEEADAATMLAAGQSHPRRVATVLRRAIALREALHAVLAALVAGNEPSAAALEIIAREGAEASSRLTLVPRGVSARGEPAAALAPPEPADPEDLLRVLARAAVELLTTVDATRLRICPGDDDGCGWVVLDTTRNRSRRWCDMGACGSAVKSKRLTDRRREARAEGER